MQQSNPQVRAERLAIFARHPVPGRAKTRLIPALGAEGAASVHAEMVRHTLETVDDLLATDPAVDATVWCAGGDQDEFGAVFGSGRDYRLQPEGDLGARMSHAFSSLLGGGSGAVIIGTDCPGLTSAILREAFDALGSADLVLGPASDGGYYLIGLRSPAPSLFDGMAWGTAAVREETLLRARRLGLKVRLLGTLDDVDVPEDLPVWERARTQRDGDRGIRISIVIPTLNEAECIARAVRSTLRPGVEVIVADGGSTDGTTDLARTTGALVVPSPCGRGPQMNAGAAAARGPVLLFLHADTVLPPDFPDVVCRALDTDRVALGAFRLRIDGGGRALRIVEAGVRLRCAVFGLPYGDQAFFLRAETFRRIGGFPDVPIMEDVAIVRRARALGSVRVVREPVLTSGRRWAAAGVIRMTLINLACGLGVSLGASPVRLAAWRDRMSAAAKPNRRDAAVPRP